MKLSFMNEAMGRKIRINRNLSGRLIAACPDFITLKTEQGPIIYVNTEHIITVAWDVIQEMPIASPVVEEVPEPNEYSIEADNFQDLLSKLHHKLIKVNHSGPHAIAGVLIGEEADKIAVLYDNKEIITFPLYHIKSISPVVKYVTQDNSGGSNDSNHNNDSSKENDGKARNNSGDADDNKNSSHNNGDKENNNSGDSDNNGRRRTGDTDNNERRRTGDTDNNERRRTDDSDNNGRRRTGDSEDDDFGDDLDTEKEREWLWDDAEDENDVSIEDNFFAPRRGSRTRRNKMKTTGRSGKTTRTAKTTGTTRANRTTRTR